MTKLLKWSLALLILVTCLQWRSTKAFFVGEKIGQLRVGAFHVRHFGQNYLSGKKTAVSHLVKILARYDIVLLQGTKDASAASLKDIKDRLNAESADSWNYIASIPLGRKKGYLEQYVYFYRMNSAKAVTSYQVNDTSRDVYTREPFSVEFAFISASQAHTNAPFHRETVVLLALNTPTDKVRQELDELSTTIKNVAAIYPRASGVIAMGDMNADCRYLSNKWRSSLELFHGEGFRSLIPDTADTLTKSSSDCAYDRVVVFGRDIDVGQAKVFDFKTWLGLDEKGALDVSDHYPVEFVLN